MSEATSLPVYIQISEMLMREIIAGRLSDGERLLPERHLAKSLNVSVGTLRKSLKDLEKKGAVLRRHGSGNYIKFSTKFKSIYSFFRVELIGGGGLPSAKNIGINLVKKPKSSPFFGESDKCLRIRRLRFLDNLPCILEEIHLDSSKIDGYKFDKISQSIYLFYKDILNLRITSAKDSATILPVPVWSPAEFKIMNFKDTVCIERLACDQFGAPIEFSRSWIDTSIARYTARIS
jgi:GntR family transcriptional regulator